MLKTVGNPSTRYGDQTIIDGSLIIGTAGEGIDFSAASHAAGMTSELLDDYEEGNCTHVIGGLGGESRQNYNYQYGKYTRSMEEFGSIAIFYFCVYGNSFEDLFDGNIIHNLRIVTKRRSFDPNA